MVKDQKLNNVEFLKEVPYEQLPNFIAGTDLYLGGPFARSLKSGLVIPNKVFESMAMKKAVIVGNCAASRELFTDGVHCRMVEQGGPEALAKAIMELKQDDLMREKIAAGGYNLVTGMLTPKKLGAKLLAILKAK